MVFDDDDDDDGNVLANDDKINFNFFSVDDIWQQTNTEQKKKIFII